MLKEISKEVVKEAVKEFAKDTIHWYSACYQAAFFSVVGYAAVKSGAEMGKMAVKGAGKAAKAITNKFSKPKADEPVEKSFEPEEPARE